MKKIAIVGAGLAGLSVAWHLLQHPSLSVTLFDPLGIGGGASGSVAGPLLHPFPGRLALSSWRSDEGMAATTELIAVAEKALGSSVADRSGVLRLAITTEQQKEFLSRAKKDPRAIWLEQEEVTQKAPLAVKAPGLWIPSGMTVFSALYLRGLWKACQSRGAHWIAERVISLEGYDATVFTTGIHLKTILPLKLTQGHVLLCRGDIPCSVASNGHISCTERKGIVQIGATYEPPSEGILPAKAKELKEKVGIFYPPAREWEEIELRSGIRASPQTGYRPLAMPLSPSTWAFGGLGSRGLLYHALLGRELAEQIKTVMKKI